MHSSVLYKTEVRKDSYAIDPNNKDIEMIVKQAQKKLEELVERFDGDVDITLTIDGKGNA